MVEWRTGGVERPWDRLTGPDRQGAYLRAAGAGDRAAIEVLVREMTPLVWQVARGQGLDHGAAAAVTREVWAALFARLDRLTEPRALAGWLITTARRAARRLQGSGTPPVPLSDELAGPPEAEVLRSVQEQRIWRAFGDLPQLCQELLRLTVLAGRTDYHAVAEAMTLPRGGVGPTRSRCLSRLRNLLSFDEPWPSSDEELSATLDTVLARADPVPPDLVPQALVAVAVDDAAADSGRWQRADAFTAWGPPAPPGPDSTRALVQPFFVYVAGDDHEAARKLAAAFTELLAQQGIEAVPDGPPVISSWAQRFTLRVKRMTTRTEVKDRLQKLEHAIEVVALQKPMSEVNAQHAEAAHKLLSAAADCDSFIALVGSMLMVKHTDETGRVQALTQTLSVAQVRALERNQHLLKSPSALLAHLETLSCTGEPTPADEVNGVVSPRGQLDRP